MHKGNTQPTEAPAERAVVAALVLPDDRNGHASDPLAEIAGLTEAAGAQVVGGLTQRLASPHPRTAFRSGKVEEIKRLCELQRADLVVVDFDLSPSQGRNLEKDIGVRIVDRSELILDIFANRARTRQAKLQVELAQAEYLRPRLMRMWTHLERMEGAIGARGPGETQLETDRRLVNRKISELKRKLTDIEDRSRRQAESRHAPVSVSLVGYTNAGKSSLLKLLTGADVYIADQLFATLDTRVRRWELDDHREVLLADTVGFVRNLPHHLVASFHATLEETLHADLLLHVCDASDPELAAHTEAVEEVLSTLGADDIPRLIVLNKIDRVSREARAKLRHDSPEAVLISARSGEGAEELDRAVSAILDRWSLHLDLDVPAGAGRLLAHIRHTARIESECFEGDRWKARVQIPPRHWNAMVPEFQAAGGKFAAV